MDIKQDIIKRLGPDIADNDKPTVVDYWPNGNIRLNEWHNKEGQIHRDNGLPARKWFYENGNNGSCLWYKNGQLHRDNDLPSRVFFYENGNAEFLQWWEGEKYLGMKRYTKKGNLDKRCKNRKN